MSIKPGALIALIVVVSIISASRVWAQACPTPPHIPYPGTQSASLFMTRYFPDGSVICQVADDGYVNDLTQYKLHLRATSSGGCQTRYSSYFPAQCNNGPYQYRWLGTTQPTDSRVAGAVGTIVPLNFVSIQEIDTRVPTGTASTGLTWSTNLLGEHVFTSQTL